MSKSIQLVLFLLAFSTPLAAKPVLNQATAAHVRPATALAANMIIPANTLAISVNTPDGPLDLLLTEATHMQEQAASMVPAIREGRTRLYRGKVAGKPASWVRLSLIDGAWMGAIQVDAKLWLLEPARGQPQLASRLGLSDQDSLVFTMDDFQGLGALDDGGVEPLAGALPKFAAPDDRNLSNQSVSGNPYFLGVTLVLDTEFQSHYGANAQSTAIGILNIVDGFYSAEANIEVYLFALEALSDNGSLVATDSGDLLNAFSTWLTDPSVPFSGLAHLLSGKDFEGSTAGRAWLGGLCSRRYGNGVNQMTFSAAGSAVILAHEMGHNFRLNHDSDGNDCPASGFIMNAITSLGNPPTQFSSCSLDSLSSYLTTSNPACLATGPNWIFNHGFE